MESVEQCQSFQRRLALGYCRLVRKYSTSGYSLPVQKVITCITTDLSADLGLKALAGKLNVTPSYLSSLFRKETGMTLTDYVNQQRIAHAQHLLLNTSFPIKSIAQQCGIADLNYFVRMFKRAAGVTPKVYRDSAAHSQHLEIVRNHKEESPFHLIGHLYLFIDGFVRSSASARLTSNGNRLRDFYIKEAFAFIEQNFQNDISVEDIAAACGLNRSYFGKIFHESMGKTPQEFLISYRMTKATELLKLTDLSISDIGNVVGYPNQLHFSRAFKNVYQISPRQWRMEHGGGKKT